MMRKTVGRSTLSVMSLCALTLSVSCSSDGGASHSSVGTVDTLTSGQILIRNPDDGMWRSGEEWRVVEEIRIGRMEGEGPDVFGNLFSFAVDGDGRFWALDGQAQELRVFSSTGEHVRTIGRRGEGPGEFAQAVRVELGPDGNMWVMDPDNNRLSVIDSAGVFTETHRALGGFIILPWPGRFDGDGYYYSPIPRMEGGPFRIGLLRSDINFSATDTLSVPTDPLERRTLTAGEGRIRAAVPFQGTLTWQLTPSGTMLAMVTDQYRIFELDRTGDTLRTITRDFSPLPVTADDREQARENMTWFTDQGGHLDVSELPRFKPVPRGFFLDEEKGYLWVELNISDSSNGHYDIFDPDGRYLGAIEMPFSLASSPSPILRDDLLYGVAEDDLGVPYLVRARIEKP
jgi:hypothetical protein